MNISIFGATGDTGRKCCQRALHSGYSVRAYSGSRTTIEGVDAITATPINLDDQDAVSDAVKGADVVISAIGGDQASRTAGLASIIQGCVAHRVRRLITVGGAGILPLPSGELLSAQESFPSFLLNVTQAHYTAYQSLLESGLAWTVICPGTMRAGESQGEYRHQGELLLDQMRGVMYDDVAHLILRCAQEDLYVQQRVSISNP